MASTLQVGTLDWLLDQDVTRSVMARDGVTPAAVRELMTRVGARLNYPTKIEHTAAADSLAVPASAC